ncbi:MAG TPA: septal ring lytic transglycosylase RlpA family protein [Geminicoccaceae bacterium]|nr:septal ring lytic transglycosylase RlpA family protein [Geminicoccus sp.]HMU48264.1 septal ring lytic transglycosylase RlpA family protein [Geminicoccaceae bacterium]
MRRSSIWLGALALICTAGAGSYLALDRSRIPVPAPKPAAIADSVVYRETGRASWYGPGFHGRTTASGDVFDQRLLTAAHRRLPLGTRVTVTNLENGKSISVAINDRGPYVGGRVLDLSKEAARRLGMVDDGVVRVRIEATRRQLASIDGNPRQARMN